MMSYDKALQADLAQRARMGKNGPYSTFLYGSTQASKRLVKARN